MALLQQNYFARAKKRRPRKRVNGTVSIFGDDAEVSFVQLPSSHATVSKRTPSSFSPQFVPSTSVLFLLFWQSVLQIDHASSLKAQSSGSASASGIGSAWQVGRPSWMRMKIAPRRGRKDWCSPHSSLNLVPSNSAS